MKYEGQFTHYYCNEDDKELAIVHDSGSGIVYNPCQHFEWIEVGNLYYEFMARKLNHGAVLRVWSGTTIYILYPKQS